MPSAPADIEAAEELMSERPNPSSVLRKAFIKGLAILLPVVITLLIISFVMGFIADALSPLTTVLTGTSLFSSQFVVTILTFIVFFVLVLATGFTAEYGTKSGRLSEQFDEFMLSIPGIASVYNSFNEMSDLLLDSDTDSFQDVKLVEYPGKDSYVVAFKTAETPDVIADETGNEDMITLFMPMAPNPVMGGFVIHVSRERVVDVDLTVEQGIRSIVTSGVAIGENPSAVSGLSEAQMRELSNASTADRIDGNDESDTAPIDEAPRPDRGEYQERLDDLDTGEDTNGDGDEQ
ncbi:MAG: putative membrane protein [Natronomonas sp.]|jgi:uncharacterized membrane protein|uniref:DUF502 domain-containing protein n=1 Tax=Natronomonas sp. TaxID=2184060 RepID=UPI0039897B75